MLLLCVCQVPGCTSVVNFSLQKSLSRAGLLAHSRCARLRACPECIQLWMPFEWHKQRNAVSVMLLQRSGSRRSRMTRAASEAHLCSSCLALADQGAYGRGPCAHRLQRQPLQLLSVCASCRCAPCTLLLHCPCTPNEPRFGT